MVRGRVGVWGFRVKTLLEEKLAESWLGVTQFPFIAALAKLSARNLGWSEVVEEFLGGRAVVPKKIFCKPHGLGGISLPAGCDLRSPPPCEQAKAFELWFSSIASAS